MKKRYRDTKKKKPKAKKKIIIMIILSAFMYTFRYNVNFISWLIRMVIGILSIYRANAVCSILLSKICVANAVHHNTIA